METLKKFMIWSQATSLLYIADTRRGLTMADGVINGHKREVHVEKTAWRRRLKEFTFLLLHPQLVILLVEPCSRTFTSLWFWAGFSGEWVVNWLVNLVQTCSLQVLIHYYGEFEISVNYLSKNSSLEACWDFGCSPNLLNYVCSIMKYL